VTKGSELDGATIGVQSGTTGELNIADFFKKNNKTYKPVVIEDGDTFGQALVSGRVDALTQDSSDLALRRAAFPNPDDYVLLPERLSKEPLAPAVLGGDDRWLEIVNWTVYATIQAEELGITSQNVDTFLKSDDPLIKRFLGVDPSLGEATGLDWRRRRSRNGRAASPSPICLRAASISPSASRRRATAAGWNGGCAPLAIPDLRRAANESWHSPVAPTARRGVCRGSQMVWRLPLAQGHSPARQRRRKGRRLRSLGLRQVDADPLRQSA